MRKLNSEPTDSHFVEIMSLITRMYKETAIAKVSVEVFFNIYFNFSMCFHLIKLVVLASLGLRNTLKVNTPGSVCRQLLQLTDPVGLRYRMLLMQPLCRMCSVSTGSPHG